MSSIANLGSGAAALPQLNIHPHGHKKGSPALTDLSSSDTAAQLPVPAAQNLFSKMLQSLEQVVGLNLTPAPAAAAAPAATATAAAGAGVTVAASTVGAAATSPQSANTLLQNYLHNAPQNQQADAAKLQSLAGSKVSFNA